MPRTTTMPAAHLSSSKDILAEVTKLARKLAAEDPALTLAQARVKVWEANPALAKRYQELLAEEKKVAPSRAPFAKLDQFQPGAVILDQVEETAVALTRRDPSITLSEAKMKVWEQNPAWASAYQEAVRRG